MRHILIALCMAASSLTMARAEDLKPVLTLERLKDGVVIQTIALMATEIDPNKSTAGDQFALWVDGKPVPDIDLPLAAIAHARRAYAYDNFTGGITETQPRMACRMAGPAEGDVLSVRYLTYENSKIIHDEMRPVMSDAVNCLFNRFIAPEKRPAEAAAAKALGRMQGWRDLLNNVR